jgi:hypothetical protein
MVKLYYENGNIEAIQTIKNGCLENDAWLFYENGQISVFAMYKNDSLHGVFKQYSMDGTLTEERLYLNGTKVLTMEISCYDDGSMLYTYHLSNENTKENNGVYGFLTYDTAKHVIETSSLGCEVIGEDTIKIGNIYSLDIVGHSGGIESLRNLELSEVVFGDFDCIPLEVDSSSYVIVKAVNNKATYNFKSTKLGYNFIVGEARFRDKENDDGSYLMWYVYKLFYVKGKNEK